MALPTFLACAACWLIPTALYANAVSGVTLKTVKADPNSAHVEIAAKVGFQGILTTAPLLLAYLGLSASEFFVMKTLVWLCIVLIAYPTHAHLNPNISVGLWTSGTVPALTLLIKLAAECIATIAVAAVVAYLAPGSSAITALAPADPADYLTSFGVEAASTFVLVLVVLSSGALIPERKKEAIAVASFVVAWSTFTSSACMDPTAALANAVYSGEYASLEIFFLAGAAGAAAAGAVYSRFVVPRLQPVGAKAKAPAAAAKRSARGRASTPAKTPPVKTPPARGKSPPKSGAASRPKRVSKSPARLKDD